MPCGDKLGGKSDVAGAKQGRLLVSGPDNVHESSADSVEVGQAGNGDGSNCVLPIFKSCG